MREKNLLVFVTEIYGDELDNKIYSTLKANNFKLLIHMVHWKDSAEMYSKANKRKNTITNRTTVWMSSQVLCASTMGAQRHLKTTTKKSLNKKQP